MAVWEALSRGVRGVQGDSVLASWGYARRYWGPYGGGTGDTRRYWGTVLWGRYGVAWRYWGVPLTPLTTQGARGGIPWPVNKLEGPCLRACTQSNRLTMALQLRWCVWWRLAGGIGVATAVLRGVVAMSMRSPLNL